MNKHDFHWKQAETEFNHVAQASISKSLHTQVSFCG